MAITIPIVSTWDGSGLDRATRDIQRAEGGFDKAAASVKALTPAATVAFGAVAGAAAVTVAAAEKAATSNARLEQVFRSMGDTTGTAAAQAVEYANALARQIGVDQNVVKETQAKLATFEAVSNEVARQSGVFDRATRAAADLAAAGFGSMESNAVQLGKALQDPAKGLTALARSGVTFTDAEKAMVKELVESNRLLEAQDIVLKAVEKQVGGVAEATANTSDKVKVAWSQAAESLGTALLPAFEALAAVLMVVADWVGRNEGLFVAIVAVVGTFSGAILAASAALKALAVIGQITKLLQVLNLTLLASPWFWVVAAIAAVVAGLVLFFTKTELGQKIWQGAMDGIKAAAEWTFGAIKRAVEVAWEVIKFAFELHPAVILYRNLDRILEVFRWVFGQVQNVLEYFVKYVQWVVDRVMGLFDRVKGVLDKLGGFIGKIPGLGMAGVDVAMMPMALDSRAARAARGGSVTYNVTVQGMSGNPLVVGRQLTDTLARFEASNGPRPW